MGDAHRYIRWYQWLEPWAPVLVGSGYAWARAPAWLWVFSFSASLTIALLLGVVLRAVRPPNYRLLAGPHVWCGESVTASELQHMHVYFMRGIVDWDRHEQPRHTAMANAAILAVQAQLLRIEFCEHAERCGRRGYHVTRTAIRVRMRSLDVARSSYWLAMGQWVHLVLYGRTDPKYRSGLYWAMVLQIRRGYWDERASERKRRAARANELRSTSVVSRTARKLTTREDDV